MEMMSSLCAWLCLSIGDYMQSYGEKEYNHRLRLSKRRNWRHLTNLTEKSSALNLKFYERKIENI